MQTHEKLSNAELLTLVIYTLGGSTSPVDLEDAAIEAYKWAPKKFCWIKYEDRIDLRIVQYSIRDACKSDMKYLKGSSKHGYMLTKMGLEWAKKQTTMDQSIDDARKLSPSDLIEKEKLRLQGTSAYRKFIMGEKEKISISDYYEFTRVNDYFPEHIRKQRYSKIDNATTSDIDLVNLWDFLKSRFREEKYG